MTEQDPPRSAYAGLVTRTLAVGIDLLVINVIAVLTAAVVNFVAGLFGHKSEISLAEAIGGIAAWAVWFFAYFVTCWNITGRTLGNYVFGIRVVDASTGGDVHLGQAIRRFFATLLAILPLGAGIISMLFDDRNRAFQDRVAHTVVPWVAPHKKRAPEPPALSPDSVIDAEAVVVPPEALPRPAAEPAPTQQT